MKRYSKITNIMTSPNVFKSYMDVCMEGMEGLAKKDEIRMEQEAKLMTEHQLITRVKTTYKYEGRVLECVFLLIIIIGLIGVFIYWGYDNNKPVTIGIVIGFGILGLLVITILIRSGWFLTNSDALI